MARLRPAPRRPAPAPLRTNDVGVAVVGTIGWSVALVVLVVVDLPADAGWWRWVCFGGLVIGLFAIWYVPRMQRGQATDADHVERGGTPARPHTDPPAASPDPAPAHPPGLAQPSDPAQP